MRQSLLAGNERDLASLDLRDTLTNLGNLGLRDVRGNVVGKALHNAVGEFGAFGAESCFAASRIWATA